MAGRVEGIDPPTPKLVVSAELSAELGEGGRDTPTPLHPCAMDDEVHQGLPAPAETMSAFANAEA